MTVETIIAAIGATAIINIAYITKPLRYFKLFRCAMCSGFWTGVILQYTENQNTFDAIKAGLITSLCAYTWYLLMKYFIERYD